VALMRHRIASVIIAVRRSYSGPGHALMPPIARQLRRMTPSAAVMSDQQASGQQDHRGPVCWSRRSFHHSHRSSATWSWRPSRQIMR